MSTKFHIQIIYIYIHDKYALPFEFIHPYKLSVFFVCVHKISLTPPLYIEVSVPSQDSERSCICVRVLILPLSMVFLLDFGNVPTVSYFYFASHCIVICVNV
jgi:hypothetical protein